MPNIGVGPQSLRDAAEAAADASEVVEGLRVREPLDGFESAMPGSRTGEKAPAVGLHLNGLAKGWAKGMELHGQSLVAAAKRYEGDDEAAEGDFKGYWDYDRTGGPTR